MQRSKCEQSNRMISRQTGTELKPVEWQVLRLTERKDVTLKVISAEMLGWLVINFNHYVYSFL